ncbi:condensin complex subunit 1-like [Uloborus diversus]|uniref:condensin complex subunit 1-like n=1 Tax=Uloborus diversus TaxID=327109 RepID=UPI00240923E7|nr:condensin complex subunit 1-like [Uloborus diversus]
MSEFIVTSRLSDLFSVSSSRQYSIKEIISKQTVTVEVLQLKRSMYDDLDGFIFKHFDTYCSLLKQFSEFDGSMKMSAFKVLLQVTEKMIVSLSSFLQDDIENFEPDTLHKKRNQLKMSVFLLCHFTQAFETEIAKKLMTAKVAKGKKKRLSMGDEYSEWSDERVKFLVIVKKLFKLPIDKLWNPPTVESEFVNFVTASYFKLLENAEVTKDKGMRMEIFKFLGTILADYSCLSYSIKIIQLAQDFEHLPSVLAEAVVYFTTECSADSLISDICRELLLLDPQSLVQNLTAAHSLSQFLIVICEGCPNKVLSSISILLQFLEWERLLHSLLEPSVVAKNLIKLLLNATTEDALNVQEFMKHFGKMGEIPSSVPKILWSNLTNSKSPVTEEEKIITILLLGMLAEVDSAVVTNHFDELIKLGLGKNAEENFQLARYTFKTLCKINQNVRGKFDCATGNNDEVLLPLDHEIVKRIKCLLIKGFTNFEDDQWTPMANEAVACLYSLVTEPTFLCAEIGVELVNILYKGPENDQEGIPIPFVISPLLLTRFLSFCGDVALHYTFYLKVDYFAHLRRQEILKEKRRRKSIVNKNLSSLHRTILSSSPKSAKKRQANNQKYQYAPPVDEETTYEQVLEMCAKEAKHATRLLGALLPAIVDACRYTLTDFHKEIQAAASLALVKFMLISEEVCEQKMQLFATIAEKSPEPYIRANMVIAMGDLTTTFPNIVEPWTLKVFQRLSDSDAYVREAALVVLTHLILHDFVRIKSLISEAAKCIADSNENISRIAKYLFTELSKKGNVIYNIIPDIISSLSDPKSGIQEEKFQVILSHMLQYIEKEKLVEGLVEKLCCRFTDSSTQVQIHELTFCLSVLTLNDKCYSKLLEFRTLLKEKMSDPVVMKYITSITANAKKNDAKTAAELEAFRTALNI